MLLAERDRRFFARMTGLPMGWLEVTVLGYAKAFSMRGPASRAEYWKFGAMSYVLTFVITPGLGLTTRPAAPEAPGQK